MMTAVTPQILSASIVNLGHLRSGDVGYLDYVPTLTRGKLTTQGTWLLRRMLVDGVRFSIVGFALGSAGFDHGDPTTALKPSRTLTEVPNRAYPSTPGTFSLTESQQMVAGPALACTCHVPLGNETNFVVGCVGLWAEIDYSPTEGEEENQYMFAIANTPMHTRINGQGMVLNVIIALGPETPFNAP